MSELYDLTNEKFIAFTKHGLVSRYHAQKASARQREIEFSLTFEEWLEIWLASGHLHERGVYVMGRLGDRGPYAVGNVAIITADQNRRDAGTRRKREYREQIHMSKIDATAFSKKLRAWRKRLKLSRREAAELLGISHRTLAGWEGGRSSKLSGPILELAQRIEDAQ